VLLVEDNEGDADLVREALDEAHAGASVFRVDRISDALVHARGGSYDIVLLDLSLPDAVELDGARRIHAEFPGLPIVVLTAREDDRLAQRAVAEGAQDYLIKGRIDGALLVRSMRYAIERQQYAERARQLAQEHSARIAAEAALSALRESESRFRAVLDQIQDYAIFVLDPEGRIASWSKGARLLKGWTQDEILGQSFEAFFPPDDIARGKPRAELKHAAREEHFEDESWRLRKDGSRFLANVVITALRGDEGRLLGFVKVTRDVTERRRAERNVEFLGRVTQELVSSREPQAAMDRLTRSMVPYVADLCRVDLVGANGGRVELVATAHVDAAKDALLREAGQRFAVLSGKSSSAVEQLRCGEPVFFPEVGERELRFVGRSAAHIDFLRSIGLRSLIAVPLQSRGAAYGAVTVGMTERGHRFDDVDLELIIELARRAELAIDNARLFNEMQRAVRVREDVLAVVSHDLRSPLSAISLAGSAATRLLERGGDVAAVGRNLSTIQRTVERADVLLRDLLDMASIRAGRLAIHKSEQEVQTLFAEAIEAHEMAAREKGITLVMCGLPARVECDRNRVLQVLSNVVANAVKFCRGGDRIELALEVDDRFATCAVVDSGPGIADDALPHVFEAYWSSAKQRGHGTGLGLFISKAIVEAHGGRMWIESRRGKGTTVRFTIPIRAV
jgi:PAS domain S-box-containing protein